MSDKTILKGVFVEFPPANYPNCRDYTKYNWDWKKHHWILSESWKREELMESRRLKLKKIYDKTRIL